MKISSKTSFFVFLVLAASLPAFSVEGKISLFLAKAPLTEGFEGYGIEEKWYDLLNRPFEAGNIDLHEKAYISDFPEDYFKEKEDLFLVIQKLTGIEKRVSGDSVFFTVGFLYLIFRGHEKTDDVIFSVCGAGRDEHEALDKCFRDAAIHIADIPDMINAERSLFRISDFYAGEYILGCGKKNSVKNGDEFRVISRRSDIDIGKLYVTNVEDEISFAAPLFLKGTVFPGDIVKHIKFFGLGSYFYFDRIFDSGGMDCIGFYEEYFRGTKSFRPVAGCEFIKSDTWNYNLYAGFKVVRRLGYTDISSLITLGRGYAEDSFRYTGGSIKLIADYTFFDRFKIFAEGAFTKWIADDQEDFSDYGGFAAGIGFAVKY